MSKANRPNPYLAPLSTMTGRIQSLGLLILFVFIAAAVFAPLLTQYGPKELVCDPFQRPGGAHWLGCNDVGQDLLTKLLYGARVSLFVGLAVATVSTLVATAIAITAGYRGGWVDQVAMRIVDVVMSLPFLPLVIVLGVYFGASIMTQVLVISFVMWAQPVRELRSQVLSIRSAGFVEASASMGASALAINIRHILPELLPLIVPQFVRVAHNAILVESSLAFLGLGDPVQDSWGSMLFHANARTAFLTGAWTNWVLPPGLAIAIAVVAFAFVGFGFSTGETRRRSKVVNVPKDEGVSPEAAADARLAVRDLVVDYAVPTTSVRAVDHVSLDLRQGEFVGLVGESGSGKTTVAMAVLGLLTPPASVNGGQVWLDRTNLLHASPALLRLLRGRRIALVPQSAMNALNPVTTVMTQIVEALRVHTELNQSEAKERAVQLLRLAEFPDDRQGAYPHELSGGMRQRAVIAIALANDPDVVIADEPTTGLDVLVQAEIMDLLVGLQRRLGISILFVTHNLPLVARVADRLAVMYQGRLVDVGAPATLDRPDRHAHTRALFANIPQLDAPKRWRREIRTDNDSSVDRPILELRKVTKTFRSPGFGRARRNVVTALDGISLRLVGGEVIGLVGGSGSGKTTIARLLTGRIQPDSGSVLYQGQPVDRLRSKDRIGMLQAVHMVFQDPYQSLRRGMRIRDIVAEPLRIAGQHAAHDLGSKVTEALSAAQLPADEEFQQRFPTALSGGQRQRVAFARAIVTNPRVIIADEPTSMLDQSIRMGVLELMETLRRDRGTSFIFITHDIVLARHFCDRLLVLRDGHMVETGEADTVTLRPQHPYTKSLIEAVETEAAPRRLAAG